MTIHKAGTMLTLTNELGTLRGALEADWDVGVTSFLYLISGRTGLCFNNMGWTVTPDRTLPTTPGSVVRSDVGGATGLFALGSDGEFAPWQSLALLGSCYDAEQITNWTLLYDAATEGVSE